jgi:hypothetical protein
MDIPLHDGHPQGKADQRPSIDPLRRVFVPIERETADGTTVFRTTDRELYMRHTDGSIRSVQKKTNGKVARKMRQHG